MKLFGTLILAGLSSVVVWSQCTFNNTFYIDATPPSCPGTMNVGCIFPGEYVTVNVIAGNNYTFTTCGGTTIDTELTLFNGAGTTVLASNDDDCGLQSTINWTATLTGTVNLLLDEWPCASSSTCVDLEVTCTPPVMSGSGCNTDITICTPGVAGPFGFNSPGPPVSSCLDFFGPDYAYIVLYITSSGPLELLIDGDAATGFLDVAIFDIPPSSDPCAEINNVGNEIGCNYADFSDGCNQFGTAFPCGSSVPSPNVTAGDVIMIVVENWSGTSSTFTMELGPPPAAQTGPPDPTIDPVATLCSTDPSFQLTAANMGGDWSGPGTSATGIFNPATAGVGSHTINYTIGQPPCQASSSTTIEVIDCSAPCSIDNFTANVGACVVGPSTYSTTGQIQFTNPPASGQLVVEDCDGVQQIFNAPFVSPINYNLTGQTADGLACDITAYFTADPTCTQTINYTAPICLCNIDNFTANIGACLSTNTFEITGTIEYSSPPAAGSLIVEVDNGTSTYTTTINPPFTSPDNYTISGIPANGAPITITVFFTSDLGCTSVINSTAPPSCDCSADIGTFNATITGSSTNNYVLCYGDEIDINSNLDYTAPAEQFAPPGPPYDPGVSWLIYSCPPTVALTPSTTEDVPDDPCFLGLLSDFNLYDLNDMGMVNAFPPGTFSDNTIYYVPITMYSMSDGTYSYVNTTLPCYELGAPFAVQYLPEFNFNIVEDCNNGTATITVSGGLPAVDGSNFTAGSLLPATANFTSTTVGNNGSFVINNLNGGENYSFTVTDGNGCPYLISGGPFPPLQDPSFSYPSTAYCTSEAATNPIISGVPGGTFSSTPVGLSLNTATGQITPSTSTPGTYTVTYTTPGPCPDNTTFVVNIASTPSVDPIPDQTVCQNDAFNAINFTGSAGSVFDWTNTNTSIGLTASGSGNIASFNGTGTTTGGASQSATITVTPSAGSCVGTPENFILTVNPLPLINAGVDQTICDGEQVTLSGTGAGVGGNYVWDNAVIDGVGFTPATTTLYTVTGTDVNGCENTDQVNVTVNPLPNVNAGSDQELCAGDATVLNASGANSYVWDNGVTDGISFTPVTTTTYTVIGTDINGCENTDDLTITVNPLPIINAGPDQTICIGDDVVLSGSGAGVGGVYAWNNSVVDGVSFSPGATLTYTVTGTDANLCTSTDDVVVNVNPLDDPSFNYPSGLTYCQTATDPSTLITGLNGGTFSFTVVSGGPTLSLNAVDGSIDLDASDLGTYTVTYNTSGAPGSLCPQTSSLTLTITDAPVADFQFDVYYCLNDIDPMPTFVGGGSGGTFSSSPVGLSINSATGLVDLSSSTPGTYTITNTINIAGCALATFDDDITIFELPNANISGSATVCPNDDLPDLTIDITSGASPWNLTYEFNGSPVTIGVGTPPHVISSASPGDYELISVIDANGCTNAISGIASVDLHASPVMNPLTDLEICEGLNLSTPVFSSDIIGSTYEWTNITGTDIGFGLTGSGNIPIFLAQNGTSSDITVIVQVIPTSPQGCEGLPENFNITIHPNPIVTFEADTLMGCSPFVVNFTNTSGFSSGDCVWDFGNGSFGVGCGTVTNTFNSPGNYTISLSITSDDGCYGQAVIADYIQVFETPEAAFSYSPQILDIGNTEVDFTNLSVGADSYQWDFGDTTALIYQINPSHTYPQIPNEYIATLVAYNGVCTDTAQQLIIIQDVIIFYVPNVFTPDHDNFNETFFPVFTSGYDPYDYHLTIFNRWGEIVFESYDATVGWDGTYSDQGLVQDGVYIWQIEFKETMSDKRHTHRGHVTVLK